MSDAKMGPPEGAQRQITYQEWADAMEADALGIACPLWECEVCGTKQGEKRRVRIKGTAFDFNASENIELRCGHWLM